LSSFGLRVPLGDSWKRLLGKQKTVRFEVLRGVRREGTMRRESEKKVGEDEQRQGRRKRALDHMHC
jgi:hypothetical protein